MKLGRRRAPVPARSFDPYAVGGWECRAWVAYYRRQWGWVLAAAVGLVRSGFRMPWPQTLRGAWLVLRANQKWAPYPDNDPAAAERLMERFYRLLQATSPSPTLDPVVAARLELAWWRAHRLAQHGPTDDAGASHDALVDAVAALYSYVYATPVGEVVHAARLRSDAMVVSDAWVAAGCAADSPMIDEERALLVRSYAALLAAVHQ